MIRRLPGLVDSHVHGAVGKSVMDGIDAIKEIGEYLEKGYKKAPIIKRTESGSIKGYGIGGGICQLSTTLYNAAEKAGLEITERHSHSKKVPYVPQGKDAMVSYGSSDLKFRNNRQNPIVIKSEISDGKVTVRLYEIRK